MNFGLPYKGSKNKIANWVCDILPKANTLYDLFCGGGAITHCASLNRKYNNYIVNDLNSLCIKGLKMAFNGEFKNEKRWISRDDFFKLKDTDYYVTCCFSFGNNFRTYAYSKDIEQFKKAMHYSVVFNDNSLLSKFINIDNLNYASDNIQDRMLYLRKYLRSFTDFKDKRIKLEKLERLARLQSFERSQRLNNLQKDNIKFYSDDYQNIPLTDKDAVIYCDIPYANTEKYKHSFDYDRFYLWTEKQEIPVYISEYEMPKDRFICVAEKEKKCKLSATTNKITVERIFRPKTQL
jgi:hypothetical protein